MKNIIEVNFGTFKSKIDTAKSYRLRVNAALPCRKHYFFFLTLSRKSVQTKARKITAPAF